MSIGQGDLLVTPLQMATVFGGVANGGTVLRPHVLKQVMASGGSAAALQAKATVTHKVPASAANIAAMQNALLGVTRVGTAQSAFAGFGMEVAGKTGTAQVNPATMKKTDPRYKDDYAWFAGYAPANSPGTRWRWSSSRAATAARSPRPRHVRCWRRWPSCL